MHYPTYFVFGALLIVMGLIQFLTRKWQGRYAHSTWKSFGMDGLARTPEFWAKASIPFNILFGVVGLVLIAASFQA